MVKNQKVIAQNMASRLRAIELSLSLKNPIFLSKSKNPAIPKLLLYLKNPQIFKNSYLRF